MTEVKSGSNDGLAHGCLLSWGLVVKAAERGYPEERSKNTQKSFLSDREVKGSSIEQKW